MARDERLLELNQGIWLANNFLARHSEHPVEMIKAEQRWEIGAKVRTPYGIGTIQEFNPVYNLYGVFLDWRPLDVQVLEHAEEMKKGPTSVKPRLQSNSQMRAQTTLATVLENDDEENAATSPQHSDSAYQGGVAENVEEGVPQEGGQDVGESSAESREKRPLIDKSKVMRSVPSQDAPCDPIPSLDPSIQISRTRKVPRKFGDAPVGAGAHSNTLRVWAQVSGRNISKFTPPTLKVFDAKKKTTAMAQTSSMFPFLAKAPENKPAAFKNGEEVSTPYGLALVLEHREKTGIVVVEMLGWRGTGYLQYGALKRMPKSILSSLLRQLSGVEGSQKALDFPYVAGTPIVTPFGLAKVERPMPLTKGSKVSRTATLGLSLESWKLANGTRPTLYCTLSTAQAWRDKKPEDSPSLLSTFNTFVFSSRTLLEPFLGQKKPQSDGRKVFKQYYKDAAAVRTKYGDGRVVRFREVDGFYVVALVQWTLQGGSHPLGYLRNDEISYRIAKGCHEGYPVLTSLGVSGKLASVEPTTGVHIVTIPTAGMVCYLQPESVLRPLKAAVGEGVLTPYGEGKVSHYDSINDFYIIELNWNAKLFAKGDTFDRVGDGIKDSEERFGVDWLFGYLFFRPETRSRSNSVVSGTQSNRSGA
jgi:hypothetical protein